jgi:apolipoprotein N-acyltransferase
MPRGWRRLIAAAAGAALLALALPRLSYWPLGWFALAPFFFAANAAKTRREAALAGLLAGTAYHAVVLHWIDATCRFAHVPEPVGLIAVGALSAFLALNWALVGAAGRWLGDVSPRFLRPWLWALLWVAAESASARWTPRIGVDVLTYTQGPNRALLQSLSWGGPHLVSFLVALVNASLAEAWLDARGRSSGDSPAVAPLAISLALTVGVWASGVVVLLNRPAPAGPTARVEVLQPDVDQYHKWNAAHVQDILAGFEELQARPRPTAPALVVWPETALPRFISRGDAPPEAAKWAKLLGATHLVGIVARPERGVAAVNGVQLVRPDGLAGGFYAKRELVPFGEYVPLRSWIPRFVLDHWLEVLDQFGDMEPGAKSQDLLVTPFGPTAVTICYEAMFPRWAHRDAARGAHLLVNVTNDGWYKDTWGPYQHYAINSLRAIENRIWVVRSGNTGISAVIDPYGFAVAELPLNTHGRLDAEIPLTDAFPQRSFFTRHGDWLGALCIGLSLLLLLRRSIIRA